MMDNKMRCSICNYCNGLSDSLDTSVDGIYREVRWRSRYNDWICSDCYNTIIETNQELEDVDDD